jgi:hypothetical protein
MHRLKSWTGSKRDFQNWGRIDCVCPSPHPLGYLPSGRIGGCYLVVAQMIEIFLWVVGGICLLIFIDFSTERW